MSNFTEIKKKATKYLGKDVEITKSTRKNKKFMVLNPSTGKYTHFGHSQYQDYTQHKDEARRENYLKRSAGISKSKDKYNANNLSRNILW